MVNDSGISNETKDILQRLKTVMNDSSSTLEISPQDSEEQEQKIINLTDKIVDGEDDIDDTQLEENNLAEPEENAEDLNSANLNDDFLSEEQDNSDFEIHPSEFSEQKIDDLAINNDINNISLDDLNLDEEIDEISHNNTLNNSWDIAKNTEFNQDSFEIEEHQAQDINIENDDLLSAPETNTDINPDIEISLDGDDKNIYMNDLDQEIAKQDKILSEELSKLAKEDTTELETSSDNKNESEDLQPIAMSNINWEDAVRSEFDDIEAISLNEEENDDLIAQAVENAKNKINSRNESSSMRLPQKKDQIEEEIAIAEDDNYDLDKFISPDLTDELDPEIDYKAIDNNYGLDDEEEDEEDDSELISNQTKKSTKDLLSEFQSNYKETVAKTNEGDSSLEGVVKEMLKDSLKIWLDKNLPDMVEKIVREEIENLKK